MRRMIITLLVIGVVGCSSYRDIPLTQGTIPYQLPAGDYKDTKGNVHREQYVRWSLSEEDLYNNTRQLEQKPTILEVLKHVGIVVGTVFVLIFGAMGIVKIVTCISNRRRKYLSKREAEILKPFNIKPEDKS